MGFNVFGVHGQPRKCFSVIDFFVELALLQLETSSLLVLNFFSVEYILENELYFFLAEIWILVPNDDIQTVLFVIEHAAQVLVNYFF